MGGHRISPLSRPERSELTGALIVRRGLEDQLKDCGGSVAASDALGAHGAQLLGLHAEGLGETAQPGEVLAMVGQRATSALKRIAVEAGSSCMTGGMAKGSGVSGNCPLGPSVIGQGTLRR
jgi:hypothetical protein